MNTTIMAGLVFAVIALLVGCGGVWELALGYTAGALGELGQNIINDDLEAPPEPGGVPGGGGGGIPARAPGQGVTNRRRRVDIGDENIVFNVPVN